MYRSEKTKKPLYAIISGFSFQVPTRIVDPTSRINEFPIVYPRRILGVGSRKKTRLPDFPTLLYIVTGLITNNLITFTCTSYFPCWAVVYCVQTGKFIQRCAQRYGAKHRSRWSLRLGFVCVHADPALELWKLFHIQFEIHIQYPISNVVLPATFTTATHT